MKQELDLIAEFREDQGKGASRRLRRQGKVPAIMYGGGRPPRALVFDQNKVLQALGHEAFYSSVLTIQVGDKSQAAILKDVQRHPAKHQIMHLDMQRILEDEEIRMHVPLHFLGDQVAPGVKQGGGTVSRLMTDVEVTCLPKDLPEYIEVDISHLELDEMLYLSDIKVPPGVSIPDLAHGEERDHPIVSIHVHKTAAIEEEEVAEAAAAVEGAEVEGAEPAEGDEKKAGEKKAEE